MKRENLKSGKKYRVAKLVADAEGALYENDVITVRSFTEVSAKDDGAVVIFVEDELGKHHTVGLKDLVEIV